MPTSFYTHTCEHGSKGSWSSSPTCHTCGAPGEFAFWSLQKFEAMARYQHVYGLKAMGPHRSYASEILDPFRATCPRCDGRGLVWSGEEACFVCPECEGTGGFWTCSDEEMEAAREKVLDRFPDAGVRLRSIPFLSGGLIQNLATGEVIHESQW